MKLDEVFGRLKYDSRMVDFNKSQGFLTDEEYQKHLSTLEDLSANAEKISIRDGSVYNTQERTNGSGSAPQY